MTDEKIHQARSITATPTRVEVKNVDKKKHEKILKTYEISRKENKNREHANQLYKVHTKFH